VNHDERGGLFASSWAVAAAIGASSCCILPLVLGSLGGSAVAAAGAIQSLRPYFLGAAPLCRIAARPARPRARRRVVEGSGTTVRVELYVLASQSPMPPME
jgi:hypothetical protein